MLVIILLFLIIFLSVLYSMCVVSGRCSRLEEEKEDIK